MTDEALTAAIRRHEERLARDPGSLAFAQLADLYRKAGRTQDAIALCRRGLARYPHYATARLILAKTWIAEERLDEASAEIRTILEGSPKDVQCLRLAAEVERRRGNVDGAADHLEKVVKLDPGDRESKVLLGLLRADPQATGESTGLARVLRDDTFATLTFGTACLEQGCLDEAAAVFTRLLRKDANNASAREGLERTLGARSRRKG
ncbi:MAG: tetratricopeptide repeat protein [Candidatus Rokubacteria bacterium]|nr:tetratricopeptide repeat protein [Candidatus Rokubacteria bacterium]